MSKSKLTNLFAIALVCLSTIALQSQAADIPGNSTQPSFPTLEQAKPEISKLNEKITEIESRFEKQFADMAKQINQRYSDELDTLKHEQRDKMESADEFKARRNNKRDELIDQRDTELAKLNVSKAAEPETAPLKARIKALTEHEYIVGTEGIETELSSYDTDQHQYAVKFRSKYTSLNLHLMNTVPLQVEEAQVFLKHWQSGLIKPEAKAKLSGEVVELVLVDEVDNTRWVELKSIFYSTSALKALSPVRLNDLFQPGRGFKDCSTCPDMIVIPAGSYDMGNANGETDEKPVHHVTFKQPFAMGKTEVTQGEWKAIMGNNPGYFKNCGETCPVEQVSWDDTQEFIKKLNLRTGKQYRLPSEAEWEYACRAGVQQDYCGGDRVETIAWYYKNSAGAPHPSAQKTANAWGLYDMSGNVWEWVEDSYHADYNAAPIDGTAWQGSGAQHVQRGGSWNVIPELVRATVRSAGVAGLRDYYYGFRVARTLP